MGHREKYGSVATISSLALKAMWYSRLHGARRIRGLKQNKKASCGVSLWQTPKATMEIASTPEQSPASVTGNNTPLVKQLPRYYWAPSETELSATGCQWTLWPELSKRSCILSALSRLVCLTQEIVIISDYLLLISKGKNNREVEVGKFEYFTF